MTREDLDGLVAAVRIITMEPVEEIELVHPREITDNKFEVNIGLFPLGGGSI